MKSLDDGGGMNGGREIGMWGLGTNRGSWMNWPGNKQSLEKTENTTTTTQKQKNKQKTNPSV